MNKAETPPIEVEDRVESNEDMRLKYRYLDLRRPVMQDRLLIRHKAAQTAREYFRSRYTNVCDRSSGRWRENPHHPRIYP